MKNFLRKIYLILTIDCERSAKLTSDSLDRPLDWSERWAARLHRVVCEKSRKLDHQVLQLERVLQKSIPADRLSDEAQQHILDRLRQR